MNKYDRTILIYFVLVLATLIFIVIGMNYDIGNPLLSEKTVIKISFSRIIDIDKKEIFDVMANIEKYPTILPKNYVSVIIINQTNNTIFAEEEIMEKGIKTKLLVKHTIFPYEKHVLEVLSGDAENTIITEIYEDVNSSVRLTTDAEIHLQGILVPFGFLAQNNLEHAMNTAIDIFVEYTRNQTRD